MTAAVTRKKFPPRATREHSTLATSRRSHALAALCGGAVALAAAVFAVPASAQGSPAATGHAGQVVVPPVTAIEWGACGAQLESFLCATVAVPTDYQDPNGPTTTLALTKLPASGTPRQRLGTLFTNPGGPGGSGVDFVQGAAKAIYSPDVLRRYDVLGFDPRGVARSDPATCFATENEEFASPLLQTIYPLAGPPEAQYVRDTRRVADLCQQRSPQRFSSASTANVARDMDLLREAVGDEKLTYAGYSYGTYLGATYAKLFPQRVGRFVLDGTVDPVAWSGTGSGDSAPTTPLGIRLRQGLAASRTFAEYARLCRDGGPQSCSLAALGDPAVVVPAIFERLAHDPVDITLPDGSTQQITQQDAVLITYLTLYSPQAWTDLADFLSSLAAPVPSPPQVAAALARTRSPLGARARGEDYPSIGGALASVCVDTAASRRVRQYPTLIAASNAKAPYFGRARGWVGLPCEFWRLKDNDAFHGPWRQSTRAPVLVIGTRFDPATPYSQTRPYANLFPAARMLTLNGWGHTAIAKSACADTAITRYLTTGTPPRDATTCAPDSVPFTPQALALKTPRPDVPPGLPLW